MGFCGKGHAPAFLPREEDSVPNLQGARWKSVSIRTGTEKLIPSGFEPRNLQHVTSHQTEYVIPVALWEIRERLEKILKFLIFMPVLTS
jgi:hypothetical protein